MNQLKRTSGEVVRTPLVEGTVIHATQHVHYHAQHWVTAFAQLHPSAQLALAVGAGLGLPLAVYVVGGLLAGVATFALAAMGIISQLIITVGAGVGVLALVVLGILAILKV